MKHLNSTESKPLTFSRLLVLLSCVALIIIYTFVNFFIQAETSNSFWLMKIIPLALFLPALYARKLRSYQWLCFLIMLYFIQAILDIFSPDRSAQGMLKTFFIMILFSAAIHYIHGNQKIMKKNQSLKEESTLSPQQEVQEQNHE